MEGVWRRREVDAQGTEASKGRLEASPATDVSEKRINVERFQSCLIYATVVVLKIDWANVETLECGSISNEIADCSLGMRNIP
jgi:hypothetical protein